MFFKTLILALWIELTEQWAAFRQRRRERGLPLKYSRRRKAYVVSDWTAPVHQSAVYLRRACFGLIFAFWALLIGAYLYDGREGLRAVINWLFFSNW